MPPRHADPGQFAFDVHGFPLFAPAVQMSDRNAPFCVIVCPGQKTLQFPAPNPVQHATGAPAPVHIALSKLPVRLAVPVVSGFRLIAMSPMNTAQNPPGQSVEIAQFIPLFVPR